MIPYKFAAFIGEIRTGLLTAKIWKSTLIFGKKSIKFVIICKGHCRKTQWQCGTLEMFVISAISDKLEETNFWLFLKQIFNKFANFADLQITSFLNVLRKTLNENLCEKINQESHGTSV